MRRTITIAITTLTLACSTASAPKTQPAPWSAAALSASEVPGVYTTEWRAAKNRETCALIAPSALGEYANAKPRRANFSGGWAVAYDLPNQRSAFGIAGTGSNASDPSYANWPNAMSWSDGSNVGYGPEGGTGPNQLAYLRVNGQGCLYNVWSSISKEHLEELLQSLRLVEP